MRRLAPLPIAAALLVWPALLNGYPIVFADSGTYLSQAIERHLGWDRPVFYSLALYPLHLQLSLWPVVLAQALLAAWLLGVLLQSTLPDAPRAGPVALACLLAALSPLPWFVSQIMPDILSGLLVIALVLLASWPERRGRGERLGLFAFSVFAAAAHASHLPLAAALVLVLLLAHRRRPDGPRRALRLAAVPALAALSLALVNLAGHGRFSPSPYGDVFLLARLMADGPARDALARHCPESGWRLCAERDLIPAASDHFLWDETSPLQHAGGAEAVADEAGAIVAAGIREEPWRALAAFARNAIEQAERFEAGDGLDPWDRIVRPVIARDFPPAELAAFDASRQGRALLAVPEWLNGFYRASAIGGLILLAAAALRPGPARVLAPVLFAALTVNAAICGGLSQPHDRYQARLIWLAPCFAALAVPGLLRASARGGAPAPGFA